MIKQHTNEWLEAKNTKVGASEIAGLVHYYCKDELQALGIEYEPYNTALQTYIKIKFGHKLPFPDSLSRWGLGMEEYISQRLSNDKKIIFDVERTNDFIIKDGLVCCSPDGYVTIKNGFEIEDYDKQVIISKSWGKGVLETKTTSFHLRDDFIGGFKWHYILQMQHQMMCCDVNWGVGAVLIPKEFWENEDFEKGVILGRIESGNYSQKEIDDLFILEFFVYSKKPQLIHLIKKALGSFQNHLDNNILPNTYNGNKKSLLASEKQILSMLYPERFGEMVAKEEEEALLSEMMILQAEKKKLECDNLRIRNNIIYLMKDAVSIVGNEYQASFDKKMALRFKKVT